MLFRSLPLTSSEVELVEATSIVNNHLITITTNGSIIDVGYINNEILSHQIFDGIRDVTTNYEVSYQVGILEITPLPITIKPADKIKVYDGISLTSNEVVFLESTELVSGQQIFITANGVITNVGIIDNEITTVVIMAGTNDVSFNYTVTFEKGLLKITPRPITIETGSSVKIYDGLPLFNHNYQVVEGNLIENHYLNVSTDTTIVDVGLVSNELGLIVLSEENDLSYNYEITYIYGSLKITPRTLNIKTGSNHKVYDGLALIELSYELVENGLLPDHSILVGDYTSITNVGVKDNELSLIILDNLRDITFNYDIIYDYGLLEITPRLITIKTASNQRVYNGLEFFDHTYEVIEGTLVSGQTIVVNEDTRIINVGEKINVLGVIVENGINDVTANYAITYSYGTLKITPLPIIIKPIDATKEYDGMPLTSNEVEILGPNLLIEGHEIFILTDGSITDVGETNNFILNVIIKEQENDVSNNYSFTTLPGLLEVTKRHITVKASEGTKVYDEIGRASCRERV